MTQGLFSKGILANNGRRAVYHTLNIFKVSINYDGLLRTFIIDFNSGQVGQKLEQNAKVMADPFPYDFKRGINDS